MKLRVHALTAFLALSVLALAVASAAPSSPAPAAADRAQWFREARFGMFIHWGVYAVPAGEWNGRKISPTQGGEWIFRLLSIPVVDYRKFGAGFTASRYDPQAWVRLAQESGMKYVVVTAKHHDGLALYDSAASDWNVVKATAAKRDLLAPLAAAVRAGGLRFGAYYSQSQDWMHPGGENYGQAPRWDPLQRGDYDDYLTKVAVPQVREILSLYKPDIIWWDTPVAMTKERVKPFADALAELAPAIISNNRLGTGFSGDTKTPEQHIPPRGYPGELFEVCMTMNRTWGYKRDDDQWKSVRQLLQNLSDITSKGGNFLLNIGPTAEGDIPVASVERLEAIGRWMKLNGEAIYATDAGPFPRRLPWGRVTQKRRADGGVSLYLHVWEWPADGKILLPTLREKPNSGRLLARPGELSFQSTSEGLLIRLTGAAPDPDVSLARLDFPGAITVTQLPYNLPGPDGRIEMGVADADFHGGAEGNFAIVGSGADAYATEWKQASWSVEYVVRAPKAGRWKVSAELGAEQPAKLTVGIKQKPPVTADISVTGDANSWRVVDLGELDLPALETTLQLKPVREGWQGGPRLRRLWLTPVN